MRSATRVIQTRFAVGLAMGAGAALLVGAWGSVLVWPGRLWDLLCLAYEAVGITFIGLAPLGGLMIWVVIRHFTADERRDAITVHDLGYVSETAPTLGILGTVIALVMAGVTLGNELQAGTAEVVLAVIPKVAEALLSTVVGLVLKWIADSIIHLIERKQAAGIAELE